MLLTASMTVVPERFLWVALFKRRGRLGCESGCELGCEPASAAWVKRCLKLTAVIRGDKAFLTTCGDVSGVTLLAVFGYCRTASPAVLAAEPVLPIAGPSFATQDTLLTD